MYRIRVLGDFPKSGIFNLIPLDLVEQAMARQMPTEWQEHMPRIIGVDPAWMGTDRSVAVFRQGLTARTLFGARGIDTIQLTERVATLAAELRPDAIFVDQTGVGAGVYDQLKRTGLPVIGVAFSGTPMEPVRFVNRRAEMWWALREWFNLSPVLEANKDLKDDLVGPEYFYTDAGKVQLESKDTMRKRGLASPDYGDALALTFAMPVRPAGDALEQSFIPPARSGWRERFDTNRRR